LSRIEVSSTNNPRFILADTSALVPLFLSDTISVVKHLKSEYGTQVVITEAVESELRFIPTVPLKRAKFQRMPPMIEKSLGTGVLEVLDLNFMIRTFGNVGDSLLKQANERGKFLANHIHRGEAYTHAAAEILGNAPVLTHDMIAVRGLFDQQLLLSRPILRAFDLIVLGYQVNHLTPEFCDDVRDGLFAIGELDSDAFRRSSFQAGLLKFYPRLLDRNRARVGSPNSVDVFDECLWLTPNK